MAAVGNKIRAVLIDLSGTLHVEATPINGAVQALKRLRNFNLGIRFVTNTTKESKKLLHERLTSMGFEINPGEIFTSLTAARQVVDKKGLRPMLFLEEGALEDFQGISTTDPNAVLIGLSPTEFHYEALNKAFRLVLDGAPLVAVHKSRYYQRKDGPALGPGPFVVGLEYATDRKAEVVGKPEAAFFLQALSELHCPPVQAIMIGDDVRDDVGGAQRCGLTGILVQTGKYRTGDEAKIDPVPDHVVADFPAAVERIISQLVT